MQIMSVRVVTSAVQLFCLDLLHLGVVAHSKQGQSLRKLR